MRVDELGELGGLSISIHPSFVSLRSVQTVLESHGTPVLLGAQNCNPEPAGAFTGEVSAPMLAKLNVSVVLVGHSERRQYFHETDQDVLAKAEAIVKAGMVPVVCVGETLQRRQDGSYLEFLSQQVGAIVTQASKGLQSKVIFAYEPIWAIGTGETATLEQAVEACEHIVKMAGVNSPKNATIESKVLYGGSVNPSNAQELLAHSSIGGLLVGGASLEPDSFAQIIRAAL